MNRRRRSSLVLVLAITSYLCLCRPVICGNPCLTQSDQQRPVGDEQITFRHTLGARGEGGRSISAFESSDGVSVTQETDTRKTARAAVAAFRRELKRAEKVIEHGAVLDSDGKKVGEKAVVEAKIGYRRMRGFEVLFVERSRLLILSSPSLHHLRMFAKNSGM
jgi:hypothetical protein